jgi:4-hydroxymandelate oxidase
VRNDEIRKTQQTLSQQQYLQIAAPFVAGQRSCRIFRSFHTAMPADLPAPISVADYERLAEGVLEPGAHAYYAGGAADELTLEENVAAWRRLAIRPRVLVGAGSCDLAITLLGQPRPHPLVIAPMAFQRLAHAEAEIATARAAAATGTIISISTFANTSIPALAEGAPGAGRWFQLYVFKDRGISRELVAQAAAHGFEALVITVDLPVVGVRERELRWPVEVEHDADLIQHAQMVSTTELTPAEIAEQTDPDLTWADIEKFAHETPLPVLVKGILAAEDAILAAEHGARGVIVSNHGGRQLDSVVAAADALPAIVEAAGERLEIMIDGGIRRGTDVLKALALGARAVLVGRPVLWGLAAGGEAGVRSVLELLLAEFETALALSGAIRAADLDPSFLVSPGRVGREP